MAKKPHDRKSLPKGLAKDPVESIKHKDTRKNIPTRELRDFVAADENAPKTMRYPRDPSLDPQLVWKGKDEQDGRDLEVPIVPIYIQEKIHPQALIEDLRRESAKSRPVDEPSLFADFNGIDDFAKKIDFYHHDQHWSNRMVLGDSLQVMTSLAEKEGLKGKVQTIYFDPPYGIKFGSNWQVSTRKREVSDGKAEDATRQPEQIRAFRDTWELGIHSYLAYLRDRLVVARDLLAGTGSVFVQIGEENVHLARCVLDEVFGSSSQCAIIAFAKTTGQTGDLLSGVNDFALWYAKDRDCVKYRPIYLRKVLGGAGGGEYTRVLGADGSMRSATQSELNSPDTLPSGAKLFRFDNLTSQSQGREKGEGAASWFPVELGGRVYRPPIQARWKTNESGMSRLQIAGRLYARENSLAYVRLLDDFPVYALSSNWSDTGIAGRPGEKVYVVQTSPKVVERCLLMTTDPGDLVLDPTCGSGTTAYVAEQWGRRWITIDTSRVALSLARTRLMSSRFPFYLLADSEDGARRERELSAGGASEGPYSDDVRKGFVCERVPHVTLKSIATNSAIREGMTRQQIDAAIAKHAEFQTLFDRPYDDPKRVRVAGPFTVESLSPHRMLSTDSEPSSVAARAAAADASGKFETMILENLRKAGVQNTRKAERLRFDRLDSHPSPVIQGVGEYTDADGKSKRVAVAVGPEHGTVGPDLVKEAAKEAVKGVGYDVLIVCGFAFDPHVSEETSRYGSLKILPARMNPDLAMGDELLKKTGSGNLFMVFGELDVAVKKLKDGTCTATLFGVDVYDPTTGEVRSSGTDDVACWFIDTNYDGESFFVRQAYFTGAAKDGEGPYDKLKRALRAEIDEAAWSALYSTSSRPFDRPTTGRVAVKVINHYGDEVLKVLSIL